MRDRLWAESAGGSRGRSAHLVAFVAYVGTEVRDREPKPAMPAASMRPRSTHSDTAAVREQRPRGRPVTTRLTVPTRIDAIAMNRPGRVGGSEETHGRKIGSCLHGGSTTRRRWPGRCGCTATGSPRTTRSASDGVTGPGSTGDANGESLSEEVARLRRENARLRRANDILRTSSAFFAAAELDRQLGS